MFPQKPRWSLALIAVGILTVLINHGCSFEPREFGEVEVTPDGGGMGGSENPVNTEGTGGVPSTVGSECTGDEECSDDLACNGTESCVNEECVAGTPVDCNPNPEECEAACEESEEGFTCRVSPLDRDGDDFFSAACVEAEEPGTDCDDHDADIHPEAVDETCDGIDADCDGVHDIDEGLHQLSGETTTLAPPEGAYNGNVVSDGAYAHSPESASVAIFTSSPLSAGGYFGRSFVFSDEPTSDLGTPNVLGDLPTSGSILAAGAQSYGLFGSDNSVLTFRLLDAEGLLLGTNETFENRSTARGSYSVVSVPGGWLLGFQNDSGDTFYRERRGPDGLPLEPAVAQATTSTYRGAVATTPLRSWMVRRTSEGSVIVEALSSALLPSGSDVILAEEVGLGGVSAVGDPRTNELLVTWRVPDGATHADYFAVTDDQRNVICPATSISQTHGSAGSTTLAAMIPWRDGGFLVVSNRDLGDIVLEHYSRDCERVGDAWLLGSYAGTLDLKIHGDQATGYIVSWLNASGPSGSSRYRRFGPNLCD